MTHRLCKVCCGGNVIGFAKYAKVKDRYCLCYFGPCDDYLVQLKLLRPVLESSFPGLKIGFGCRDEKTHIFDDCQYVMKASDIKVMREEFGHIREIRFNGTTHPVEDLLNECRIKQCAVPTPSPIDHTSKCVVVTKGHYPTKDLEKDKVERLKKMATESGYYVELDTDVGDAGLVMGAESYKLFEAAGRGIQTKLLPTGLGTRLYKLMFPNGVVLHN